MNYEEKAAMRAVKQAKRFESAQRKALEKHLRKTQKLSKAAAKLEAEISRATETELRTRTPEESFPPFAGAENVFNPKPRREPTRVVPVRSRMAASTETIQGPRVQERELERRRPEMQPWSRQAYGQTAQPWSRRAYGRTPVA
ncbi:MAG: hypothetical protein GOV15_01670, partial [Candidatus Diapherotrites archaeon]|nr:hypothetical protein [Candidatus Diapherotrites archaeon]